MRARAVALLSVVAFVAGSCGRATTISTTSPSAPKCQVSVESTMTSAPATGGNGSLTISTTRDCTWDASSGVNWIALTSAANGQGSGTVAYRVDPNGAPASRKGTLEVNGTPVSVAQDAAPCRFTVSPLTSSVSAAGGSVSVSVDTLNGCAWTASSQTPWVRVTSGANASAPGTVSITVDANAGAARTGAVSVAGQSVTISQSEAAAPPTPCAFAINPTAGSSSSSGSSGTIAVATAATCAWTAASNAMWIAVTGGASGTGNANVTYTVAPNSGPDRTGTLTVAGNTFTMTQAAAGCSYAIAPSGQSIASGGGTGSFAVTTGSWCSWTAASGAPWITITGGGSGSGNGNVALTVAANGGAARSGTIVVGGQTFTVSQAAAACSYSIAPASQSVDSGGGSGSFAVTTAGYCAWSATASAPWISITGGGSGSGNGTVAFNVAGYGGNNARTGTITVEGQTFTITQAAAPACSYSISPGSQSFDSSGGNGAVRVNTDKKCPWTAASNNGDWLTVTSGSSDSGDGSVGFSVAANSGAARSGTITIAGQTFTVNQAGAPPPPPPPPPPPCTYSIAPASQDLTAAGGSGTVTITASDASCGWTAASNAPWLMITSAASGTGSSAVSFSAAANGDGVPRSGTLTIAGQTFTVNQSASH